ncbi:MAG: oxidoreductase [Verrucomicrobiota bacterium]
MRLEDQVILITGSTTGIGASMARLFVKEGGKVILHGRNRERGADLLEEFGPESAAFVEGDLIDPEGPRKVAEAAVECFGRVDSLINNAAFTTRGHIEDTDVEFFDRIIAVNLRAPLQLIRNLLPELEKNQGCVVNIGSVLSHCGQANMLAYSISKGGLMTMTRNLADSLGPRKVRVNQLNVGWTLTDNEYEVKLSDGLPANWPETLPLDTVPSGKLITPEQIAEAAVYWASRASRPISGSVLELEQYPIIGRYGNHEDPDNKPK